MKNKVLKLGVILFVVGSIVSGLFAIANSISYLAFTTSRIAGAVNQTVAGLFCFLFLIIAVVGLGMSIAAIVKKDKE